MKANTPEKLYISDSELNDTEHCIIWFKSQQNEDDIEYIRTDAFINKACEWLKENFSFDEAGYCKTNIYSTESMIYNFKNTLGGKL